jgi:hypothetical protein
MFIINFKKKIISIEKILLFFSVISLLILMFIYKLNYGNQYFLFTNYTITIFVLVNITRILITRENILFFIIIFFVGFFVSFHSFINYDYIEFNSIKTLRYLLFCSLFFYLGFSELFMEKFYKIIIKTTITLFFVGAILYFFMPSIMSITDYGDVYRFKLLLSEPSALAPFCGILTIYSLQHRKIFILFLILFAIVYSKSVIVTLTVLASFFYSITKKQLVYFFFVSLLFSIIFLYFNFFDQIFIYQRFKSFLKALLTYSIIEPNFELLLTNINERTANLHKIFLNMKNNHSLLLGFGLNQNPYLETEGLRSYSLLHHFLLSFGILGLAFILLFSLLMIIYFKNTPHSYLFPFILYALINSAQGLLIQGMWFTALAVFIHNLFKIKKLNIKFTKY